MDNTQSLMLYYQQNLPNKQLIQNMSKTGTSDCGDNHIFNPQQNQFPLIIQKPLTIDVMKLENMSKTADNNDQSFKESPRVYLLPGTKRQSNYIPTSLRYQVIKASPDYSNRSTNDVQPRSMDSLSLFPDQNQKILFQPPEKINTLKLNRLLVKPAQVKERSRTGLQKYLEVKTKLFKIFRQGAVQHSVLQVQSSQIKFHREQYFSQQQEEKQKKKKPNPKDYPVFPPLNISQLSLIPKPSQVTIQVSKNKTVNNNPKVVLQSIPDHDDSRFLEQYYYDALQGINVRCYNKKEISLRNDEKIKTLLIINFEGKYLIDQNIQGLLLNYQKNFWQPFNDITPCSGYFKNNVPSCESYCCPCSLKLNLKQTLKFLSKHCVIVLFFTSGFIQTQKWYHYLQKNNYDFDGIFYISKQQTKQTSRELTPAGVKYDKIIKDMKLYFVNHIIIFDNLAQEVIDTGDLQKESLRVDESLHEYFQQKIPLVKSQEECKLSVIYMSNIYKTQPFNDSFIIYDIAKSLAQDEKKFYIRTPVSLLRLNLNAVIEKIIDLDVNNQQTEMIIRKFKQAKDRVQNPIKSQQKIIEQESWIARTETFRIDILDYIKSMLTEKISNLHYMIGEYVLRNQSLFRKQARDPLFSAKMKAILQSMYDIKSELKHQSFKFIDMENDLDTSNPKEYEQGRISNINFLICVESK